MKTDQELQEMRITRDATHYSCQECGSKWKRKGGPTPWLCPKRCNGTYSRAQLRERGWRPCEIDRLEADVALPNPHYSRKGAPMKLYDRRRIHALEKAGRREAAAPGKH